MLYNKTVKDLFAVNVNKCLHALPTTCVQYQLWPAEGDGSPRTSVQAEVPLGEQSVSRAISAGPV